MKYFILLISFVFSFALSAQEIDTVLVEFDSLESDQDSLDDEYEYYYVYDIPTYRLGISPTALVNYFPAFQLSHDFKVNDDVEFSIETGYVFTSAYGGKGLRIRVSEEFYLFRNEYIGVFAGGALTNLFLFEKFEQTIELENAYFKEFTSFRYKYLIGAYLTGGFKWYLGKGVFWENSIGIGVADIFQWSSRELTDPRGEFRSFFPMQNGSNVVLGSYINSNFSVPIDVELPQIDWEKVFKPKKKKKKKSKKKKKKKRKNRRR